MRGPTDYSRLLTDVSDLAWATKEQDRLHRLLLACARVFAAGCNSSPNPKRPMDVMRRSALLYGRGLGADEARGFLRALDTGLVTFEPDGAFNVPSARACSPNLHLVGRNGDHVRLHGEVLVHVAAYSELVLDKGWNPAWIAFDPFISGAHLDLWGFADVRGDNQKWSDGRIVFVAEAKARTTGPDSLTALAAAFAVWQNDPTAPGEKGHRSKWDELNSLVAEHGALELLLAADGDRWWYDVTPGPDQRPTLVRRFPDLPLNFRP